MSCARVRGMSHTGRQSIRPRRPTDILGAARICRALTSVFGAIDLHVVLKRPGLRRAIAGLPRVLVCPIISNKLSFAFLPASMVYSHKLAVFPLPTHTAFCVLHSRVHEVWARMFSSTMK